MQQPGGEDPTPPDGGGPAPPDGPIDVVVVTWNSRDATLRCLRTLLEASPGLDLRLHVRDNASADGTAEAVRAAFPEADVQAGQTNLGFAAGVNAALEHCSAPWVLLLNSDAWPTPGALDALLAAARAQPGLSAAAPRLERPDGTLEVSALPLPALWLSALLAVRAERWLPAPVADRLLLAPGWAHDRPRTVPWAHGAVLLIPRAALRTVGGFDERYFMYAEELDWFWRACDAGLRVRFEPAAVFVHEGGASATTRFGGELETVRWSNAQLAFQRRYGRPRALAFGALNILGSAVRWAAARRRRPGEAAVWRATARVQLTALRRVSLRRAETSASAPRPGGEP